MKVFKMIKIKLKVAYIALYKEQSIYEVFLEALLKTYLAERKPQNDPRIGEIC
jgi:uncharacterized membrane protein